MTNYTAGSIGYSIKVFIATKLGDQRLESQRSKNQWKPS